MGDCRSALHEGFSKGVSEVLSSQSTVEALEKRELVELAEAGRRAVHLAVAPLLWNERLGPMLETAQVCERLGVSRQAVAKAVDAGRLMAIPAGNTRRFSAWQFNFAERTEIRPDVAQVLTAFKDVYPETRPIQVAAWAMTSQPELKDDTPSNWLDNAGPIEPLLLAARRAAAGLAQ